MAFSFVSLNYTYSVLTTTIEEIFDETFSGNEITENSVSEFNDKVESALKNIEERLSPELTTQKSDFPAVSETEAVTSNDLLTIYNSADNHIKSLEIRTDDSAVSMQEEFLKQSLLTKVQQQNYSQSSAVKPISTNQRVVEKVEERNLTVEFLKYNYDFSYQPGRLTLGSAQAISNVKEKNISDYNDNSEFIKKESNKKQKQHESVLLKELNKKIEAAQERQKRELESSRKNDFNRQTAESIWLKKVF